MEVIIIEQFQVLTEYHKGISDSEALIINDLLKNGYCIYLECVNDIEVINWHIYDKYERDGQLMSGSNFENFKNNKYEANDF